MKFDLFKNQPVKFVYRGKGHDLIAQIHTINDPHSLDSYGLSEQQLEAVMAGGCDVMCIKVSVSLGDVEGFDSLGGVFVYESSDINQTVRDHKMIEEALTVLEARLDNILSLVGVS